MHPFQTFRRQTSIKTKGVVYVIGLIVVIFLTVSILVVSTVRRNLKWQLGQFHQSIARKLSQTASDVLLSRDYGYLMEQIRQLRAAGEIARVRIIDRRHIIVASDRIKDIGSRDDKLMRFLQRSTVPVPLPGGDILMPIKIEGVTLGALRVGFDRAAESRRIDGELRRTIRRILYLALVIFVLGISGAFIISRALTRPIIELLREIDQFDQEIYPDDASRKQISCQDEALQLRDAFTRMMTNLRVYLQRNKKIAKEQEKLTCMAAIGQMSAQIAHETRNSLYAIRGAVSGLEKGGDPAESKEYVEVIKEEIQEMKRMSDDFLQFARTPEPELIPCLVDEVVQRVAELLEPDLEEGGIKLERTGTVPRVLADPTLLKRAFMNLFLNAIQAMEDGGIITVEYRLAGNFVEIRIQDEGPGIPEDVNLKVFQPFFSTKINGSGLGLPTVYKLMAAQHGEVDLEESAIGARFMIQLPVADKR
ncbi:ATP-binding protein [Desulfobacterota bacterium M19]